MKTKLSYVIALFLIFSLNGYASIESAQLQSIRGQVIDQDSKMPLVGANIIILNSDPLKGTSTDVDGYFRIDQVKPGRVNLRVSCLGYEETVIPNLLVVSGKESVLEIELKESLIKIEEAVITANGHKAEALNEMALISAKAFSVEETKRFAGSFDDPARMAASFAGVVGTGSGNNDIIVRGNSSKGILWKLDGIDIPNPNHFGAEGSTGGPINALNSAMLNNSDFYSGAFAPEYGNAYAGVLDMKLRNGNNEKREYTISVGVIGLEAAIEGPFSKNYKGSYLINYRYSSLSILDQAGLVDYGGIPKYQDLAFKFHLPTKKAGTFQLIGFGGISSILEESYFEENEDSLATEMDYGGDVGFVALKHIYPISDRTFITSYVSASAIRNSSDYVRRFSDGIIRKAYKQEYVNSNLRASTNINTKLTAQHRIKAGITYTELAYDMFTERDFLGTGTFFNDLDVNGNAGLVQAYANWKYRIVEDVTLVTGLHYMHFLLNNSNSIEPRIGFNWDVTKKQTFSLGFGIHSKVESVATYHLNIEDENTGIVSKPNKDLGLSKAIHYVLGYSNRISRNVNLKSELYYQHLYDLAVENDPNSMYALSNDIAGFTDKALVNKGTGYNYGIEFTLERFFANNYYFLVTGSLYESKIKALDGTWRNSRFNGNYAANVLFGKEWKVGKATKNRTFGINSKVSIIGGHYYTPVDLDASLAEGYEQYHEDQFFAKKADDIFQVDLSITHRRNREKSTHELKLDIQNLTGNQAMIYERYDDVKQTVEKGYQLNVVPTIIYTIQF